VEGDRRRRWAGGLGDKPRDPRGVLRLEEAALGLLGGIATTRPARNCDCALLSDDIATNFGLLGLSQWTHVRLSFFFVTRQSSILRLSNSVQKMEERI